MEQQADTCLDELAKINELKVRWKYNPTIRLDVHDFVVDAFGYQNNMIHNTPDGQLSCQFKCF